MDLRALVSVIAVIFPIFPKFISDITCYNGAIPGEYVVDNDTNSKYFLATPKFTMIADGLVGAEGPIFDTKGNFYVVTMYDLPSNSSEENENLQDGLAGKLFKIDLKTGEKTIMCAPWADNFGGRPVGAAADKEGNLWIADLRLGLLKYTPGKECERFPRVDTEGNPLLGLDDLIFDEEGNLWITGPFSPVAPAPENITKAITEKIGVLYYLAKGTRHLVRIPGERFRFNNGIVVRGSLLLQTETFTNKIIAFDITGPGEVRNRRVWATLPKEQIDGIGGPDGIDYDAAGNLLVAHAGGSFIEVFSPEARLVARIKVPFQRPSNMQFAPGSCTCYVTDHETHAVYKFDWVCKGWPTYAELQ